MEWKGEDKGRVKQYRVERSGSEWSGVGTEQSKEEWSGVGQIRAE